MAVLFCAITFSVTGGYLTSEKKSQSLILQGNRLSVKTQANIIGEVSGESMEEIRI